MDRITQNTDGSYQWSCPIDKDFHRRSGWQGLWAVLLICVFVFLIFFAVNRGSSAKDDLWIPLLVIGVILVIALPLIILWILAGDPHEQYVLTEDYVKSGYGKSSIYSEFKNTKDVLITEKYIEMSGKYKTNRIYIPSEDMDFVRKFILKRVPEDTRIRNG